MIIEIPCLDPSGHSEDSRPNITTAIPVLLATDIGPSASVLLELGKYGLYIVYAANATYKFTLFIQMNHV